MDIKLSVVDYSCAIPRNAYQRRCMNYFRGILIKDDTSVDYQRRPFVQDQLRLLLDGRPYEELHEFCDFSLADQNEAVAAKGVAPAAPVDFQPVVKKSIMYIVAAVIINDKGEVRNFKKSLIFILIYSIRTKYIKKSRFLFKVF